MTNRSYTLSIAGFDPSGGAGLLADIKTMECLGVYGLGVCTANTFQVDNRFEGVRWTRPGDILFQLEMILERYDIKYAKIGLIESAGVLLKVLQVLRENNISVIWDPVLTASAGFQFHDGFEKGVLSQILESAFLITPNLDEAQVLFGGVTKPSFSNWNVLLKGGHSTGTSVEDVLFMYGNEPKKFISDRLNGTKHGTGCVLSSAIAAYLTLGYRIAEAVENSRQYVHGLIQSNSSLLGYHNLNPIAQNA